jgi:ribosome assembly protein YihI (activator of Der GTPase)
MLEQLQQIVQQFSQQAVVENQAVPNEQNQAVMDEAQNTIVNGLQNLAQSGQLNNLAEQVQAGQAVDTNHPAVQQLSGNLAGNLMQKFGLNNGAATGIASSLIPMVLGKILGNKSQGAGAFDLGGLLSSLGGGAATGQAQSGFAGGGLMDKISNIGAQFGLDKDGDGDVDLNDIKKMI